MVKKSIVKAVKRYLRVLPESGIHPTMAILYGSFARGEQRRYSDIDLVVVAPELEPPRTIEQVKKLWFTRKFADLRIEPIPCGVKEWKSGDGRPILEIARQEGVIIKS